MYGGYAWLGAHKVRHDGKGIMGFVYGPRTYMYAGSSKASTYPTVQKYMRDK